MQFHIDQDSGTIISGWVIPDNPKAAPVLTIRRPGRPDITHVANNLRPDIQKLGLHSTGTVGFNIDASVVPELAACPDVSIWDQHTGVLLHRRAPGIPHKLFIFDISMTAAASAAMNEQLGSRFTMTYEAIERHPFDTLFGILNNQFSQSIYASGRLALLRYQSLLRANNFLCAAILRHPFEDLALRLEIAQRAALSVPIEAENYAFGLEPIIELMRTTSLGDLPSLQMAINNMTSEQSLVISNPLIKALACTGDEPPDRRHIALALENLAAMQVVGSYGRFDDFRSSLSDILGEPLLQTYAPQLSLDVKEASSVLARLEPVRRLLSLDLALYSYVEDAFNAAEAELIHNAVSGEG